MMVRFLRICCTCSRAGLAQGGRLERHSTSAAVRGTPDVLPTLAATADPEQPRLGSAESQSKSQPPSGSRARNAVNEGRLADSVRPILSREVDEAQRALALPKVGLTALSFRGDRLDPSQARPAIGDTTPSRPPIAAEMQNHAKMVQSACGEPRRSLRGKHEEGSDEQTRFHQSEHGGTCCRHDSCR